MTNPIPEGYEGIIAHLIVDDAAKAIEFYKNAFGAEEIMRAPTPDCSKIMHAEVRIGSSIAFLCDDFPEFCGGQSRTPKSLGNTPVTIHQFVTDVDAVVSKAEAAGAKVTMPAQDMFWGDRYGIVEDPFGHTWSFATHIKDVTPEEMAAAAEQMFSGGG